MIKRSKGCSTFTQTIWLESHAINLTTEFDAEGEETKQSRKNCIASNHNQFFLTKCPKQNEANHLIFLLKFPVFPCRW